MNENDVFNQKLQDIGGEEFLEGILLLGGDKEEILNFINANTGYEYEINSNGLLTKVSEELKDNKNLDGKYQTFLDIEIEAAINGKRKIILAFNNEEMDKDLEILKSDDKRIVLLNSSKYKVAERFVEIVDEHDSEIKVERDLLYNEGLTDRLIKSLYDQPKIIMTRSSTATVGTMAQNQNVQFGPGEKNYASAGSVNAGEEVYILSKAYGYYHIQYHVGSTGQEKQGYVPQTSVYDYTGPNPEEEDYFGGFCYASTELDVRTCDDFSKTAPVGTLFKHEGCTMIFHYEFSENGKSYHVAYIEYSTSSGTKRGYVYNQYLIFPFDTCVGVVNTNITVYGGPSETEYDSIGSLSSLEFVGILAKEGDNIYVEYNTTGGRKRGYIRYSQLVAFNRPAVFPDFYANGVVAHIIPQRCIVRGGPNANYAELGAVNNEEVTCFNTNGAGDEYTFEYTCIEYKVDSTGKKKRGYVLATEVIGGNLPEENNPIESFENYYPYFGSKINYGTTQKGRNMFYYKSGFGPNHLFLVFAQHGWEDGTKSDGSYYHGDGNMLLKVAKQFMIRFANLAGNRIDNIRKKWTIYVFPGINLDGIINGNSNNGFGRCFKNGIDPNRSWPGHFKVFTSPRNYTGNSYLGAQELVNLKNTLVANRGFGKNVLLDIHGWENSFLSDSTELSNYFMSEMRQLNSAFKYKDTTGSTTDNGYLIRWAHNSIGLSTTSSEMAGLGATSGLLEFPSTKDYSDNNILNNYAVRFFNGAINLLENMSVSTEPSLSTFCNSLQTLYNLATSYSESKGNNISVTEKNHLVLQYLRHKKYNGELWSVVAGLENNEFNAYAEKNAPGLLPEFLSLPIPGFRNIAIEHWAATLDSNVQSSIFDSEANDLSGWAGDLLQLGACLEQYASNPTESDIYNLMGGTDDGLAKRLGGSEATVDTFGYGYEDWVSDVDSVCIALEAKNNVPIYQAVNNYYSNVNNSYSNRYNTFINTILGKSSSDIRADLTELVTRYTETKTATSILFAHHFNYNKVYASQLANQFVNKILSYSSY